MTYQEGSRTILDVQSTASTRNSTQQPSSLALTDDLDRAGLQVRLATLAREIDATRANIIAEETRQREALDEYNRILDPLINEVAELEAEIERLTLRLERLEYADQPLSDSELDDQEHRDRSEAAAFWAEWQYDREERARQYNGNHRRNGGYRSDIKRLYRRLARLIHPDLATDAADRAGREVAMRLANIAFEAGDRDQLRRMVEMWSSAKPSSAFPSLDGLTQLADKRDAELAELNRKYRDLVRSSSARFARSAKRERQRKLSREQDKLRRQIAGLRLRRRRLLRSVSARRKEIAEVAD